MSKSRMSECKCQTGASGVTARGPLCMATGSMGSRIAYVKTGLDAGVSAALCLGPGGGGTLACASRGAACGAPTAHRIRVTLTRYSWCCGGGAWPPDPRLPTRNRPLDRQTSMKSTEFGVLQKTITGPLLRGARYPARYARSVSPERLAGKSRKGGPGGRPGVRTTIHGSRGRGRDERVVRVVCGSDLCPVAPGPVGVEDAAATCPT